MLFFAKAALACVLAIQVTALPTDSPTLHTVYLEDPANTTVSRQVEYHPRSDMSRSHRLVPRLSPADGEYGYALAKWIMAIIQWASELHIADMTAREDMMRGSMEILEHNYPQSDGWHHFAFIQHKGFKAEYTYWGDKLEESHHYKRKDLADSTEMFKFVAFRGTGWVDKGGYDGGWANWAYSNDGRRDGERVYWD